MNNTDKEYQRLLKLILDKGRVKKNRTGTDTIGVFGAQARFDLSEGFPLLTTKKVNFAAIVHELLWFIRGDTNIKYLVDNNVHIWDGDCYRKYKTEWDKQGLSICVDGAKWGKDIGARSYQILSKEEFIEKIKNDNEFAQKWGELGQGTYGQMWRAFPYFTEIEKDLTAKYLLDKGSDKLLNLGTVDQLQKVIDKLKTNPDDRRMIVSAWHPFWVENCCLPPCHLLYNFNTEELSAQERWDLLDKYNKDENGPKDLFKYADIEENFDGFIVSCDKIGVPRRRLNCLLLIRSNDFFLGAPFNIASYSLLIEMVAQMVNMVPGELVYTVSDLHLYKNHVEQAKIQLAREPKKLPNLVLNKNIKNLFDFKFEDIKLEGYDPHPTIKGEVSTG